MTDMRFIKSVYNDWKLAVHRQWKALLILVGMSVIFCVDFRLLLAEAYANHPYIEYGRLSILYFWWNGGICTIEGGGISVSQYLDLYKRADLIFVITLSGGRTV